VLDMSVDVNWQPNSRPVLIKLLFEYLSVWLQINSSSLLALRKTTCFTKTYFSRMEHQVFSSRRRAGVEEDAQTTG